MCCEYCFINPTWNLELYLLLFSDLFYIHHNPYTGESFLSEVSETNFFINEIFCFFSFKMPSIIVGSCYVKNKAR